MAVGLVSGYLSSLANESKPTYYGIRNQER